MKLTISKKDDASTAKKDIMQLFGTLKFKKSSQQMKDESRKAWQ